MCTTGHKLELIRRTTYFCSVMVFGTVRVLEDNRERRTAIEKLAVKYALRDSLEHHAQAIHQVWKPLCILEMTIAGFSALYRKKARSRAKYAVIYRHRNEYPLCFDFFRYPEADTTISSIVWAGRRKTWPLQKSSRNRGSAAFVHMAVAGCVWS